MCGLVSHRQLRLAGLLACLLLSSQWAKSLAARLRRPDSPSKLTPVAVTSTLAPTLPSPGLRLQLCSCICSAQVGGLPGFSSEQVVRGSIFEGRGGNRTG